MNHRSAHLPATGSQLLVYHDHVDRPADSANGIAQAHGLSDAVIHLGLDHKEVQVAVFCQLSASSGPEQDHSRLRCGLRQATACLLYRGVVKHDAQV